MNIFYYLPKFIFQAWKVLADKNIRSNEQREHRGDFIATVTRQDPSDLKLREILAKYLANTLNEEKYHHEAVTVNSLTHDQLPTLKDIVDASHFWMSDHSRFWYHLEQGSDMFNAGAVLVTDTGEYIRHLCLPIISRKYRCTLDFIEFLLYTPHFC